jgi:predicted RNA-binding protein with PIN domain
MNRLHYILDGYNIIHAIPSLKRTLVHDAESARELLIHSAGQYCITKKIRCTIVFDGVAPDNDRKEPSHAPIHVVYSSPLTADAKIKQMIEHSKRRSLLVIISSDREILRYAQVCSCQSHTSGHFARLLADTDDIVTEKSDAPLSPAQIDEWLKLFGEK